MSIESRYFAQARDFFKYYIGSCWVEISEVTRQMRAAGYNNGRFVLDGFILHHFIHKGCWIKMYLRRPESITREELTELIPLIKSSRRGEGLFPNMVVNGQVINAFINKEDPVILHFFISRGFDVFGLIENGHAHDLEHEPFLKEVRERWFELPDNFRT